MATNVFAPTESYTSVATLIANLKAQREKALPLVRVPTDDLLKRPDRPAAPSKPAFVPAIAVGATVRVPALALVGKLVSVKAPSVAGGTAVYRIGWLEPAAGNAYREAGFWLEDIEVVAAKSR